MPVEYLTPKIEDRAFEIQSMLAERGQHRAPAIPDLLIAATAHAHEAVLYTRNAEDLRGIEGLVEIRAV